VASVEEMAFGHIDENKNFAFSLKTPRGPIRLASNSEEGMMVVVVVVVVVVVMVVVMVMVMALAVRIVVIVSMHSRSRCWTKRSLMQSR
jgi:hypothetical protein